MAGQPAAAARIGVDVGGTNTDVILVTETDEYIFKTPTTTDPSISTLEGIVEICERASVDPESVNQLLHGTTVATNALVEHEGATTGMLTTAGFRDVTHIGRHRKPHNFSLQQTIPWQEHPIVGRRHRKTVPERIEPPGEVVTPLDESAVIERTAELVDDGVESIAVCYLHSYIDTTHEDRTKELIQDEFPDLYVSTSNEVVAQFREFERFTTTAINASLQPVMSAYLERLERRVADAGFDAEILIMQSNGGMASLETSKRMPVTTLVSGPAAGVLSGEFEGQQAREDKLIALDMGGTSADISVYPGRVLERDARDSTVGGYPTIVPMLDIETIGSGGGSIAWVDRAGGFNVGPKSAGADPGPACYGRGNEQPTVTDAQVALGRIDPGSFLGGRLEIDPELSSAAIRERLSSVLGSERFESVERAALATLEVTNNNMYRAIREQTVQRGYDPRQYTLIAFGGAGPMHATEIAENLNVSTILIPPSPGISSARGLLTGDVKYDNLVTVSQRLGEIDTDLVAERFDVLEARGRDQLERDGIDEEAMEFHRSADMLYEGQGYELNVDFVDIDGDWQSSLRQAFEDKHAAEYGHYFEDDPIELLNLRVTAVGRIRSYEPISLDRGDGDPDQAKTTASTVVFGTSESPREMTVDRYDRERLDADDRISGPAIIDEFDSTIVIQPGWVATVAESSAIKLTPE